MLHLIYLGPPGNNESSTTRLYHRSEQRITSKCVNFAEEEIEL